MSENTNTQPEQPAGGEGTRTDATTEVSSQAEPQNTAAPTPSGDVAPASASAPQQAAASSPVPPQPAPASQQPYSEAHQQQPFYPSQPVMPPAPLAALTGGMKFGWFVIGALVGIAHGYDAMQAIFESVAMTSNGGIVTGIVSPGMPVTLEAAYIVLMWAGRLEFVTFLALVVEIVVSIVPRRQVKKQ